MTDKEKGEDVLIYMRRYKWNLKHLLDTIKKNSTAPMFSRQYARYKEAVAETVCQTDGVKVFIKDQEDTFLADFVPTVLGRRLRRELNNLGDTTSFGRCKKGGDIEELENAITGAVPTLKSEAPLLVTIIRAATRDTRPNGKTTNDYPVDGRFVMIAAILGHIYHHNTCNTMQVCMSQYLQGNGVRTKVFDTLSLLGLTRGSTDVALKYTALKDTGKRKVRELGRSPIAVFTYDNFEYTTGTRGDRIGDRQTFFSIITALVTLGRLMPPRAIILRFSLVFVSASNMIGTAPLMRLNFSYWSFSILFNGAIIKQIVRLISCRIRGAVWNIRLFP